MKNYDFKKLVIVVGAGMSMNPPTNLPSGIDLTKFCLNEVLKENSSQILCSWNDINDYLLTHNTGTSIGQIPRLETIISAYKNVSSHETAFDFLNGFKSFIDLEFNLGHLLIAALYSLGATIITFNFDNCINKAYEYLTNGDLLIKQNFSVPLYRSKDKENCIVYLHGMAYEIDSLGFSVDTLMKGFENDVENLIREIVSSQSTILFVGYSCSDTIDFTPLLKKLSSFNNCTALYIKYDYYNSGNTLTWAEIDKEYNIAKLLKLFPEYSAVYANPEKYLDALIRNSKLNSISRLSSKTDEFSEKNSKLKRNTEIWKSRFLKHTSLISDNSRMLSLFFITDNLRVGYNLISPKSIFELGPTYDNKLIYIQQSTSKFRDDKKLLKKYTKSIAKFKNDKAAVNYIKKRKDKKRDFTQAINQLNNIGNLSWNINSPITTIQNEVRYIINRNFFKNNTSISNMDRRKLLQIEKAIQNVKDFDNKSFSKLNISGLILRLDTIIKVLLYGERLTNNFIEIMRVKYIDISLIDGITSVYRDMAIAEYLYYKYHSDKEVQILYTSIQHLIHSMRIANFAGNKRDEKRAKTYLRLLYIRDSIKYLFKNI